jgi:uncharacterized LabA/DUF88 family protein
VLFPISEMLIDAFKYADPARDEIVLLAGDSDYLPAVARLREEGFVVLVYFWSQAAAELKQVATAFVEMDGHLEALELL